MKHPPFVLLPQKALWWTETNTIIVSDVHIGKAGHFRKSGIAIPTDINRDNLWRLAGLLLDHKPERLLILGDLSHSFHNKEWDEFADMRAQFSQCAFQLVQGNHDILPKTFLEEADIQTTPLLEEGGFSFTHAPENTSGYNISGHLHPAVSLKGQGRQRLKLPCFWFGQQGAVLPAFGAFTGTQRVSVQKNDAVYVVVDDRVMSVKDQLHA